MGKLYRHYGENINDIDFDRKYMSVRGDKPDGLWASPVSCGRPWKEWCEKEGYEIEKLDRHFDFTLKPGARILEVRTKEDAAPYIRSLLGGLIQEFDHRSLQRDFDGMEVYLSDNWRLKDMNVFYYWDVDSIVIWNLDVIDVQGGTPEDGHGGQESVAENSPDELPDKYVKNIIAEIGVAKEKLDYIRAVCEFLKTEVPPAPASRSALSGSGGEDALIFEQFLSPERIDWPDTDNE